MQPTIASLASTGVEDPYAAIRNLKLKRIEAPEWGGYKSVYDLSNTPDEGDGLTPANGPDSARPSKYHTWRNIGSTLDNEVQSDARTYTPVAGWQETYDYGFDGPGFEAIDRPFQSKYNKIISGGPGDTVNLSFQQPGKHKYDTMNAAYKLDPATGQYTLQGTPAPTREVSGFQKDFLDPFETGAGFIATAAAGYYGVNLLGGAAGAAGAAGGAGGAGAAAAGETGALAGAAGGAAGGVGSSIAETIALMEANGLTAAEIMAATGGNVAGFTAADIAAMGAASGASGAAGGIKGSWTGEGFGGAGSSGLGSLGSGLSSAISAGAKGMGASDWIQLAGLAGGLWSSNKAQNNAKDGAAAAQATSNEMLAFNKQQYADALPYIKAAQGKSLEVADAMLASQKQNDALAKDYADYNKGTYRPLEQGIVADATGYDTPSRRQSEADAAVAGVHSQAGAMRDGRARTLASQGINPGSTRSMAALDGMDAQTIGAASTAAYQARKGVEDTGYARRVNAASLGRNLPANQVASSNAAVNAGTGAVNTSIAGANAGVQNGQLLNQGYTGAANTNLAVGQLQQRANDSSNALWGNLGKVFGNSDVAVKKDIEPTDPNAALQEINATPVSDWKYDPQAMAAKGIPMEGDPGEQHTGPMAQDVNATMGEETAPGGKKIDLVSMNGKLMLAVQALDAKINSIAQLIQGQQQGVPA